MQWKNSFAYHKTYREVLPHLSYRKFTSFINNSIAITYWLDIDYFLLMISSIWKWFDDRVRARDFFMFIFILHWKITHIIHKVCVCVCVCVCVVCAHQAK